MSGTLIGESLSGSEPKEITIGEVVAATPLSGILNTPVSVVLKSLGLNDIRAIPHGNSDGALGIPPLPAINLEILLKPITELFSLFGSGKVGSGSEIDPTQIFAGLSKLLTGVLDTSSAALKILDKLWSGPAAAANGVKTTAAAANSAQVGTQAQSISANVTTAAGMVAAGVVKMEAVIAKFVATIVASGPALLTPGGQAAVVAAAGVALTDALAVVCETKAELALPTTTLAGAGSKIPITASPQRGGTGVLGAGTQSGLALATSLLDGVVKPVVTTFTSTMEQAVKSLSPKEINPGTNLGRGKDFQDRENRSSADGSYSSSADCGHSNCHCVGGQSFNGANQTKPAAVASGSGFVGERGMMNSTGALSAVLGAYNGASASSFTVAGMKSVEPAVFNQGLSDLSKTSQPTARGISINNGLPVGGLPLGGGAGLGSGDSENSREIPDYLVGPRNGIQIVGELADNAPELFGGQRFNDGSALPPNDDPNLLLWQEK